MIRKIAIGISVIVLLLVVTLLKDLAQQTGGSHGLISFITLVGAIGLIFLANKFDKKKQLKKSDSFDKVKPNIIEPKKIKLAFYISFVGTVLFYY